MKDRTINIFFFIAMAGLFIYFAYVRGWIFVNYTSISAKQAYVLLQEDDNVTLLDVRSRGEYQRGHIKKAILIPVESLERDISQLDKFKNREIIVYCQTGSRSVRASRILIKHGFRPLNVKDEFKTWEKESIVGGKH